MSAQFQTCRGRGVVVVLASGAVISLAGLSGGIVPAFADPVTEPTVSTAPVSPPRPAAESPPVTLPDIPPPVAPRTAAVIPQAPPVIPQAPPPASPPQTQASVAPPHPPDPPPRAPLFTPEPPRAATTAANPPVTTEPPKARYAAPSNTAPSTTEPAPMTTTAQSPPSLAAPTTSAQSPPSSAPGTTPAQNPPSLAPATASAAPVTTNAAPTTVVSPASPSTSSTGTSQAPAASSNPTPPTGASGAGTEPGASGSEHSSGAAVPTSPTGSQAQQVMSTPQPEKVQAPRQDVELAKASLPIEQRPDPAPKRDVDNLWNAIKPPNPTGDRRDPGQGWSTQIRPSAEGEWDHRVRQWDRNWVHYDEYYRPVICNPYRDDLRVAYIYGGEPRIVVIPPLASIAMEVADYGAYNFTAVLLNAFGAAANVAVGSFSVAAMTPGRDCHLRPLRRR